MARDNIKNNNVVIKLIKSDLFNNINDKFDVIISNPPYIDYDEEIDKIVKDNEPHVALYASDNGLYFYDKILDNCKNKLNDKYLICFEIGYMQALKIKDMIFKYFGKDVNISIEKDYSDKDRFIFIWN